MALNLSDSISSTGKPPLARGTKFALLLATFVVVLIVYFKISPSDEVPRTTGQAMALISRNLPEIKQPAEKEPAPMPQPRPQAQAPRPQPAPKPVVKREKDPFAEMQQKKRLEAIWAPLTGGKQNQGQQQNVNGHSQGTGPQTLEIPPTTQANGNDGNVWNSNFYNQKNGQAGPLQYAGQYVIRRGWKIPCRLNERINTDSPGQVSCTVVADVYDSQTGKHKLIPGGAQFNGAYDTQTYYGQQQVAVSWDELQFPNGTYRHIPSMPGADQAGVAGVPGKVNNHLLPTIARSALLTITGATAMWATRGAYGGSDLDPSEALAAEGGRELRRGGERIGRRGMNRPPTVTTEAGTVILILVTAPIPFDGPYRDDLDYADID